MVTNADLEQDYLVKIADEEVLRSFEAVVEISPESLDRSLWFSQADMPGGSWRAMSDETTCQKYGHEELPVYFVQHQYDPTCSNWTRFKLLSDSWGCVSCDALLSGE